MQCVEIDSFYIINIKEKKNIQHHILNNLLNGEVYVTFLNFACT